MKIKLEKRLNIPQWQLIAAPLASVILALFAGALLIAATGNNPLEVYKMLLWGAFGTRYGTSETIVKSIPLMIISLGISIPMHMQLYNIGGEGQFYMGAIAASWLALYGPALPPFWMLLGMFVLGSIAGGICAALAAFPRALWGIDEVITTLLLNYIVILWVDHLTHGPWKDPLGNQGNAASAVFTSAAHLPRFADTRVHLGVLVAIIIAVGLYVILKRSKWGFELRVAGRSLPAGRYAGMKVTKTMIFAMFISGAIAGIAGMTEVSGVVHRLQPKISTGYGYSALIVARLARLNPFGIILVSILFGALLVGSYMMQTVGLSSQVAAMLQGIILFFVLISEFFIQYRFRIVGQTEDAPKLPPSEETA